MKLIILKSQVWTFHLQKKFSWNCRIHKDQEMTKTYLWRQKNEVGSTSQNKAKSSLNTLIAKFYCITVICFTYRQALHLSYAIVSVCSFANVPVCTAGHMKIASFLVCQQIQSALWCACYIQFIVSVARPLTTSVCSPSG